MSSSTKEKPPKDKVGIKTISAKEIAVAKRLTPFEDLIHIAAIASISIGGRKDIGAIILKKNDGLQIKFCFECQGIHPSLPEEQIVPIFEGIEAGLKEIPYGETLTLHLGSFTEDFDRQQELKAIENGCCREELMLLMRSERLRIRELTKNGTRKNKFLRIYCTYTLSGSEDGKTADIVEKFILNLKDAWDKFTGQIHQVRYQRVESILKNSFTSGFQLWEQTLTNKMGLSLRALSASEIWAILWKQFNTSTPPSIPQLLILDDDGVKEEQNSDYHIRHLILEREESVPFLDRSWVYLQNHYIGALTFAEKPAGWVDEYAQLRYLWELIARDKVSDTEIICQLSRANEALAKTALQRITKQSIVSSAMSAENNSVDVKASLNMEEAIAAQETIYKGAELRKERLTDFKEFLKSALMTMVLGTNAIGMDSAMVSNIESIITLAIETFFADDDIKLRYKEALEKGLGTPEWNDTPTLEDFYKYCSPGYIKLDTITNNSENILKALDQIRLRLRFWLNSRVGQSISRPSSFRTDAKLLVFALRSLNSEGDAAILALSAYAAALRRALSSKASIFFLDEAPILFQFEAIAELIGTLCANGAKAGIRVILSAQEPDSIYQSKSAAKIFANLTTRLIGRIQTSSVDPFVKHFKYPYEIISRNSTEAFFPKKAGIYSQWLLDDNSKFTFCRYYPAHCLLAAVANNPQEQELRTLFFTKYKNDPMLGMVRFSEVYIKMIRGEELTGEAYELLNQAKYKITQNNNFTKNLNKVAYSNHK
ncbi:MAG: hypothetical protein KME23_06700 [Goleter apudmare HA4340-LM2]|jgi:hypothetical protein|nr:hypothetical protein [Goleter apudmare HA4340-LM2]